MLVIVQNCDVWHHSLGPAQSQATTRIHREQTRGRLIQVDKITAYHEAVRVISLYIWLHMSPLRLSHLISLRDFITAFHIHFHLLNTHKSVSSRIRNYTLVSSLHMSLLSLSTLPFLFTSSISSTHPKHFGT